MKSPKLSNLSPRNWSFRTKIAIIIIGSSLFGVSFAFLIQFILSTDPKLSTILISLGVVALLTSPGSYIVGGKLSHHIRALTNSLQKMEALEEKDLKEFEKQGEVGELAHEIYELMDRLKDENAQNMKLIANIRDAVERLSQYSSNILTISHEQATGASEQATAIQEAFTTSKEIAVTSKEIANNAVSVTDVAENANNACQDGNERVGTAVKGMNQVKEQVSSLADKMLELGKSNQKIGKVVDIIDEISERTNLLALNAAIEAAGAGSAGKRFGIVASEIRRLAEKTVEATLQIKNLINAMQEVTNATIMSTEQAIHAVGESYQLVQDVGEALQNISDLVQKTSKAAKEISFSTQQQTSASEQMSVAIAEVNQVAEHFVKGSEETAQAIEELNELTKNMKELIYQK